MSKVPIRLRVNEREVEVWAWPNQTLLEVLRDEAGATEVKYGCGEGICGTCTVLLDGESVNSCLMYGVQAEGAAITTLKGLGGDGRPLHRLQENFLEHGASQCGFCTPGMLVTAFEFVREHPDPTREEIRTALAGNLCRCTGYAKIVDAVEAYARGEAESGR
jgi:aerobic carbon-monoxide dehydrogenase small subunit